MTEKKTTKTEKQAEKKQPAELKGENLDEVIGGGNIIATELDAGRKLRRKVTDGGLGDDDLTANGT